MDKLTKKQQGFVKDYIETGNATEAAERNYDVKNRNVANAIGAENLAKPSIEKVIIAFAERIDDNLLEKVQREGLEANKIISANIIYGDADEKTNDFIEVPDHAVRHKFFDSTLKIKGHYAPEKSINLNLNGDIMPTAELEALAKQLNDIARSNTRKSINGDGINTNAVDSEI